MRYRPQALFAASPTLPLAALRSSRKDLAMLADRLSSLQHVMGHVSVNELLQPSETTPGDNSGSSVLVRVFAVRCIFNYSMSLACACLYIFSIISLSV